MRFGFGPYFPFRRDNRKPDGTWDAPDATDDNIKGTSVDPRDPVWPHWKQTPPPGGEGEFISEQPYFDIDEITQRAFLNRLNARGFPKALQDVILERAPNGVPQFASVGGNLGTQAANPAALTGDNATAYRAARAIANDLLYGSEYNSL